MPERLGEVSRMVASLVADYRHGNQVAGVAALFAAGYDELPLVVTVLIDGFGQGIAYPGLAMAAG